MSEAKTVVFFPEAAFGPALNCVGIAQVLRKMGHNPVFACDRGFKGVFEGYGFPEYLVNMSGDMSDDDVARYWDNFIAEQLPNFKLSPFEQISTYVMACWDAIVDTSDSAEDGLREQLARIKPDIVCVDNVILFPAIKKAGCPWMRTISCSENEIPDENIPPHLSGCGEDDHECFKAYNEEFLKVIKPVHDRFNRFLESVGHEPYPLGQFFEESPYMNLLLYPKMLKFKRKKELDPDRFQYLEGCVRSEEPYEVPQFEIHNNKPLVYVSYGSLGASDIELYKRMIKLFSKLPYRFLMNIGEYKSAYIDVPGNIHLNSWFLQPSVLPQVDLFIHHGGNNSFNEGLYFGKPAIIMPYVWDGHDNAQRLEDTGYGRKLERYSWSDEQLTNMMEELINDTAMHDRLKSISEHMQKAKGREKAAKIILEVIEKK